MKFKVRAAILPLALSLHLGGCATLPSGTPEPRDRFERLNRSVYKFNTALDHAILRPVARTYVKVTPKRIRGSVSNFILNLEYPVTIINDYLQGKVRDGFSDFARFAVNTVVGIGGLFDPASHWGLEMHDGFWSNSRKMGRTIGSVSDDTAIGPLHGA